jgi:hypothetical protein
MVSAATGTDDVALTVKSRPTAVEPGTATVPVRLGFVRAITVPVGTPVDIDIAGDEHRDVVVVPAAAIVREGDETAVFIVSAGKAHKHDVEVGLTDHTKTEIVSGVAAGDRVIVDGQAGLPDDAAVTETAGSTDASASRGPEAEAKDEDGGAFQHSAPPPKGPAQPGSASSTRAKDASR